MWSTPAKLGGEGVVVQYAPTDTGAWVDTYRSGTDLYMRQKIGTGDWSSSIKIVGEKGDTGPAGSSLISVAGSQASVGGTYYTKINNVAIGASETRGHILRFISPITGTIFSETHWDTYGPDADTPADSLGNADALAAYLNSASGNYIVSLYSFDATACTANLRTALNNLGGSSTSTWTKGHVGHAFIGAIGLSKGQGFEKVVVGGNVVVSAYFTTNGLIVNGVAGVSGTDGVAAYLTNPTHNLQATSTGTLLAGEAAAASTSFVVQEGGADVTSSYSFSAGTPTTGLTVSGTNPFAVATLTVDSGYVDLTATRSGYANIVLRFSVARLKAAADGTSPVLVYLTANYQGIVYNENGVTPSPTITTFTATPKNAVGTITYVFKVDGTIITSSGTTASYNLPASIFTTPISVVVEMKSGTTIVATDNLTITATKIGATGPAGSTIIEAGGNTNYDTNTSYLKVDNVLLGGDTSRGHTLRLYDRETKTLALNVFYDTWGGTSTSVGISGSLGDVNALATALEGLSGPAHTKYIIVLISRDACTCNAALRAAIRNKGGGLTNTWTDSETSHVFIGAVNLLPGQGFEKIATSAGVVVSAYFTTATGLIVNGAAGYTPIKGVDYFDGTPSTVPGADGATALFAYQLLYNATSIPTAPVIGVSASINLTTATIGGGWCSIPVSSTLAAGYYQFQVSGTFKASTQVYTWQTQSYLSNFKVGTLDALSANIGTLRTAVNGPRTEIADNIIRVYDQYSNLRVKLGNLSL